MNSTMSNLSRRAFLFSAAFVLLELEGCSSQSINMPTSSLSSNQSEPEILTKITQQSSGKSLEKANKILRDWHVDLDKFIELGELDQWEAFVIRDENRAVACVDEGVYIRRLDGQYYPTVFNELSQIDSNWDYSQAELPLERFSLSAVGTLHGSQEGSVCLWDYRIPNPDYYTIFDLSAGEQLVTNDRIDCIEFHQIIEEGYVGHIRNAKEIIKQCNEINGIEIVFEQQTVEDILKEQFGVICNYGPYNPSEAFLLSQSPQTLLFGRYDKTRYVEETVEIDGWYALYGGVIAYCPVVKTKKGYFEIDTSTLVPGTYVMYDGKVGHSLLTVI